MNPRVCVKPPIENRPTDASGEGETAGRRRVCSCTREYSPRATATTPHHTTTVRIHYYYIQGVGTRNYHSSITPASGDAS